MAVLFCIGGGGNAGGEEHGCGRERLEVLPSTKMYFFRAAHSASTTCNQATMEFSMFCRSARSRDSKSEGVGNERKKGISFSNNGCFGGVEERDWRRYEEQADCAHSNSP